MHPQQLNSEQTTQLNQEINPTLDVLQSIKQSRQVSKPNSYLQQRNTATDRMEVNGHTSEDDKILTENEFKIKSKRKRYSPHKSTNVTRQKITKPSPTTSNKYSALDKVDEEEHLPQVPLNKTNKISVKIPPFILHGEIQKALADEGHTVTKIMNVHNMESKQPKNLLFIDLKNNENNEDILFLTGITNLLHAERFEVPHKYHIIQCKRCQNSGHSINQCTLPYRCVKCAGNYDYRNFEKRKNDGKPAKCTLCGGDHPSNYKKCQAYLEIQARRYPHKNVSEIIANKQHNENTHPITKRTYTPVVQNQQPSTMPQPTTNGNQQDSQFHFIRKLTENNRKPTTYN
ncbi:unnamed protein product [Diabrotica balteata]|uniref:Pre-C2HC domain-containing protein n=1 Tax=Diabrotica balteata TaxID=107213 RepID=A0A9N9SW96_DIABA|nr:unnamed protein product [Diabrotica balteata]